MRDVIRNNVQLRPITKNSSGGDLPLLDLGRYAYCYWLAFLGSTLIVVPSYYESSYCRGRKMY